MKITKLCVKGSLTAHIIEIITFLYPFLITQFCISAKFDVALKGIALFLYYHTPGTSQMETLFLDSLFFSKIKVM